MTIRITLVLCQYAKLRNADYVQHQLEVDGTGSEKVTIETDLKEVLDNEERKASATHTLTYDDNLLPKGFEKETEWIKSHNNSVLDHRSMPLADGKNTFKQKFD